MVEIRRTVKIESDGSPAGTTVTDIETGHKLPVTYVRFDHQGHDVPEAELEIPLAALEYKGLASIVLIGEFGEQLEVQRKQDQAHR